MENQQRKFRPEEESDNAEIYRRIKENAIETIIMAQRLQNLVFLTSELVRSLDHIPTSSNSTNPDLLIMLHNAETKKTAAEKYNIEKPFC